MSDNSNNLDLFYKKKYYKYKNKYLIEKNKLDGGLITFKSGLFGFFVNECYAARMGINFEEGKDAPSIYELNNKLHFDGYRMEHNSDILELLVDNKHRTKEFMEFLIPILYVFAFFAIFAGGSGNLNFPSSSSSYTSSKFNTLVGRFTEKCKVDLNDDNEIISLIEKLIKNKLPFIFRFGKNRTNPDPNINIDCCIIIDVSRTGKNKFKRIVRLPPTSNIVKL
jgi:hypothetical protein